MDRSPPNTSASCAPSWHGLLCAAINLVVYLGSYAVFATSTLSPLDVALLQAVQFLTTIGFFRCAWVVYGLMRGAPRRAP